LNSEADRIDEIDRAGMDIGRGRRLNEA